MERIAIIGSGGTGKSTLAKELGKILRLPIYHLDAIFWRPGWVQRPQEEFDQILIDLVSKDKWIIDGNYSKTMDIRLNKADMIIFLDYPTYISLFRVIKRRIQYHGKTRPDMGEGCNEKIDMEFIQWILNFRKNKRPEIIKKLSKLRDHEKVHIFKTPRELDNYINNFKEKEC